MNTTHQHKRWKIAFPTKECVGIRFFFLTTRHILTYVLVSSAVFTSAGGTPWKNGAREPGLRGVLSVLNEDDVRVGGHVLDAVPLGLGR